MGNRLHRMRGASIVRYARTGGSAALTMIPFKFGSSRLWRAPSTGAWVGDDPTQIYPGARPERSASEKVNNLGPMAPRSRKIRNYPRAPSSRRSGLVGPHTTPPIVKSKYMTSTRREGYFGAVHAGVNILIWTSRKSVDHETNDRVVVHGDGTRADGRRSCVSSISEIVGSRDGRAGSSGV